MSHGHSTCRNPPALSPWAGQEEWGKRCCGSGFFPLFSELIFIMRGLFLKCRWETSPAGLNAVVLCLCRLSFHQSLTSTAKTRHSLWRCFVEAVPCLGSWCLNKISNFLEDAKGVRALVGWGYEGCTTLQLGWEGNASEHW